MTARGPGFHFEAPAGWNVRRTKTVTAASSGANSTTLVSATAFKLLKPYSPKLFARAAKELDKVAANLATQAHGALTESATVTVDGRRIRAYRLTVRPASGKAFDERIGFVLEGTHEYQLLCRVPSGADDPGGACALLYASFTTA